MCELPDGKSGSATALTIWRGPRSRDAVTLRRIQPSRVDAEPEESREWRICTEHRAIDRLLGRLYSRAQSKKKRLNFLFTGAASLILIFAISSCLSKTSFPALRSNLATKWCCPENG